MSTASLQSFLLKFSANWIVGVLDNFRIALFRITLKSSLLRRVYSNRSRRLGVSFLFFSILYLYLSLNWSLVLLVFGPVILGYPHLVASFRFLSRCVGTFIKDRTRIFKIFLFLTSLSLGIRFLVPKFLVPPDVPYGFWEIILSISALSFIRVKFFSIRHGLVFLLTGMTIFAILGLAWADPLAFIGFALIFHNWEAFGHWICASKKLEEKFVAYSATFLFATFHFFVFYGFLDNWISMPNLNFISTQSFEIRGWVLASWSQNQMVWDRMIVLYSFGLSLHYFIWLQAIPQCLDKNIVPKSFRKSLEELKGDCGPKTFSLLVLGGLLALFIWVFTPWFGQAYFGLAMLHGWLELGFLIVGLYISLFGLANSCS